jgi:hypothetical protein
MEKATALVVVVGGVAEVYEPAHVDARVIDLDDLKACGEPVTLPRGIGFEQLIERAGLVAGLDFDWEEA